ncbi:DUF397 domain-containing protein [Saccharopolyspora gloriosae]|uniref:DUF397 domain-containing protein n=1 Tax=Saccharopolyspora gloriosae TaxID=455344 RepID=UPI00215FF87C|nr:DUF397 domain-containing protein [Saccharopolyspora gloriosae]
MDTGWFQSSRSAAASDNCVEVRITADEVGVRDSKERAGAVVAFARPAWARSSPTPRLDASTSRCDARGG